MSLELRKVGRKTYVIGYQRVGDVVVKTHQGSIDDPAAMLAYRSDRLQRAEQSSQRRRVDRDRNQNTLIEGRMNLLVAVAHARKSLFAFIDPSFKPNESPGASMNVNNPIEDDLDFDAVARAVTSTPKPHALAALRRSAAAGDKDAVAELDRFARLAPDLVRSLFQVVGAAKRMVINDLADNDRLTTQAVILELENRLIQLLSRTDDHPIDRMVAELTAITWLDAARCSIIAARSYDRRSDANYFQTLSDRATRRFMKLASIQKSA